MTNDRAAQRDEVVRLADRRALVIDAGGAIAMAIPFSATPTEVTVRGPGVTVTGQYRPSCL